MARRIIVDPERIYTKHDMNQYMREVFAFEEDYASINLDALYDSLSEVNVETEIILTPDSLMKICASDYAYKVLLVLGDSAAENPYIHICFRENGVR